MTSGVAGERPTPERGRVQSAFLVLAVLVVAVGLAPPIAPLARRYVYAEALQFSLFALVAPALVVLGAPWTLLPGGRSGALAVRLLRLADGRRRHPEFLRSLFFLVIDVAALIVWRVPALVNALAHNAALVWLEMATLIVAGVGLWLELVDSEPFRPRGSFPIRIALSALTMWSTWALAYVVGLSHASWYRGYHHVAGQGLSLEADQQILTGVMWTIALACFIPVIFSNLILWLRGDENPDEELHRLLREERRRARVMGEPSSRSTKTS